MVTQNSQSSAKKSKVFLKATNDEVYDHYRLPRSVRPEQYNLRVFTYLENADNKFSFTGDVQIKLQVQQATKNITLHARNLIIKPFNIQVECITHNNNNILDIAKVTQYEKFDYIFIHLVHTLKPNLSYLLTIEFSGLLSRYMHGYYLSSYKDLNTDTTRYLALTQFEPAFARTAFPCFDEPDFKARFVIAIAHDMRYKALSNMPLQATMPVYNSTNLQWSIFEESLPMSTYLIAYTVNDFTSLSSSMPNREGKPYFHTWARADAIDQCHFAAKVGPKILAYYERIFGIEFPLAKLDQIGVPDFNAGAMENWGLITYREAALLYSKNISSLADKQRTASIIAHELAHQWFGNLVTMKWWSDLWLNEGFATYVATLGVNNLCKKWHSYDEESLDNILSIFKLDAFACSHPISNKIENVADISEQFDTISYKKGSAVIRMMQMFMGFDSFRIGLVAYLKKYAYKNADQNNLWKSLTRVACKSNVLPKKMSIRKIMNTWTLQSGYPLIRVNRDYVNNTIEITQKRFWLNQDNNKKSNSNQCWYVPLSYTNGNTMNFRDTLPKHWLKCNQVNGTSKVKINNIADVDVWIILNIQLGSPYRVDYDEINWNKIILTLLSDDYKRIHVLNRAQLVDDAFNLAWAGYRDYRVPIALLDYMKYETELFPWRAALDNLGTINRILRQTSMYESFRKYMWQLLLPAYKKMHGLNGTMCGSPQAVQLKVLISSWACRMELVDCIKSARRYFKKWRGVSRHKGFNPIPKDIRNVVYCTSLRHGSADDWQFLWRRYKKSNVANEKRNIIDALGCTNDIWLLHQYLIWAFEPKSLIRKQDAAHVFISVAHRDIGYFVAKQFFITHIHSLNKFYNGQLTDMGRMLSTLAHQMSTKHDYRQLKTLIKKNPEIFKNGNMGIRRAREIVKLQIQWHERNSEIFVRRLQERTES